MKALRFLCVLLLPGCIGTKMVPPPGPPVPIPPDTLRTEGPPPSAGKGRLVIDVVGTVATAFEIKDGTSKDDPDSRTVDVLCVDTPCAVNLTRGKHTLAFASPRGLVGRETVEVFPRPTVVREQLGYVQTHRVVFYSGAFVATAGVVALLVGIALVSQTDSPALDPVAVRGAREAGAASLVASGGLFGLAWLLLHLGRTEIQPSSMTTFPEPR